jgi:hypothetical protein
MHKNPADRVYFFYIFSFACDVFERQAARKLGSYDLTLWQAATVSRAISSYIHQFHSEKVHQDHRKR